MIHDYLGLTVWWIQIVKVKGTDVLHLIPSLFYVSRGEIRPILFFYYTETAKTHCHILTQLQCY